MREGKFVGIFYFLWHGAHEPSGPWDLSKILQEEPNPYGPPGAFHHWAKPELGYYRSDDPYVFEVHAEWLAAARVDVIVIDVSNGHSYSENLRVLCETWLRLRELGNPTPQISFLAHTDQGKVVRELFDQFYDRDKYDGLWFRWGGMPLLLARRDLVDEELRTKFTFRESWAWTRTEWFGDGRGKWAWLDDTPQAPGLGEAGEVEQISVAVAQHATSNKGRSYSDGKQPDEPDRKPESGIYFAEQWARALEVDPDFIFVTGWNEWVAQRFVKSSDLDPWTQLAGRDLSWGDSIFVDAYTMEYSRDIEPMEGGYGWNYYYQLVDGVRRFKGAAPTEVVPAADGIRVDGKLGEWSVFSEFRDFRGESLSRHHEGWAPGSMLVLEGKAVDFLRALVSRDEDHLYFGIEYLPLREKPFTLRFTLSSGEGGGDGRRIQLDIAVDRGSAAIESLPDGWGTADVGVAATEGSLELSLNKTVLGGRHQLGFAWSDVSSSVLSNGLPIAGDEFPVSDFFFPFILP
ncbi:hypothetical protein QEH56_05265 [Pelagicoccus enzymogenes]|uniref:hypothetical protein n=1 Tax=Pelagicoccus enzymogenes TaxID=2773457 RepID=UPI00280EF455|nr:hypothetical protein [Pelagicoccus enzymogenes]MDQ8197546.1 hypothetical protein [Pelagicoccus enzymogenes]